jgi:hypothetical protein
MERKSFLTEAGQLSHDRRSKHACKVCQNIPDEDGVLEHGRGCFVADPDGGGQTFVVFDEEENGTVGNPEPLPKESP